MKFNGHTAYEDPCTGRIPMEFVEDPSNMNERNEAHNYDNLLEVPLVHGKNIGSKLVLPQAVQPKNHQNKIMDMI